MLNKWSCCKEDINLEPESHQRARNLSEWVLFGSRNGFERDWKRQKSPCFTILLKLISICFTQRSNLQAWILPGTHIFYSYLSVSLFSSLSFSGNLGRNVWKRKKSLWLFWNNMEKRNCFNEHARNISMRKL